MKEFYDWSKIKTNILVIYKNLDYIKELIKLKKNLPAEK